MKAFHPLKEWFCSNSIFVTTPFPFIRTTLALWNSSFQPTFGKNFEKFRLWLPEERKLAWRSVFCLNEFTRKCRLEKMENGSNYYWNAGWKWSVLHPYFFNFNSPWAFSLIFQLGFSTYNVPVLPLMMVSNSPFKGFFREHGETYSWSIQRTELV